MKNNKTLFLVLAIFILLALFVGKKYYHKNISDITPEYNLDSEYDLDGCDPTLGEGECNLETRVENWFESYHGLYQGNLPCADCSSIFTSLTLKEGGKFDFSEQYRTSQDPADYYKNKENLFKYSGDYSVKGDILTITDSKNKEQRFFKILENSFLVIGANGDEPQEGLKEDYILTKLIEE